MALLFDAALRCIGRSGNPADATSYDEVYALQSKGILRSMTTRFIVPLVSVGRHARHGERAPAAAAPLRIRQCFASLSRVGAVEAVGQSVQTAMVAAPLLLQPLWRTWPLLLPILSKVRRDNCACEQVKHSRRTWSAVTQLVGGLLLASVRLWPAQAVTEQLHLWSRAGEMIGARATQTHVFVQQCLLQLPQRTAQEVKRYELWAAAAAPPSPPAAADTKQAVVQLGVQRRGERTSSTGEAQLAGVVEFICTAGSRFPVGVTEASSTPLAKQLSTPSPSSNVSTCAPSLTLGPHEHSYVLSRADGTPLVADLIDHRRVPAATSGAQGGGRSSLPPWVSRSGVSLSSSERKSPEPASASVISPSSSAHNVRESQAAPSFTVYHHVRTNSEAALESPRVGRDVHNQLDVLGREMTAASSGLPHLLWQAASDRRRLQLVDAPLIHSLHAGAIKHPTMAAVSSFWREVPESLVQLSSSRSARQPQQWVEMERQHLAPCLLAYDQAAREHADNSLRTAVKGLANVVKTCHWQDAPELNLPLGIRMSSQSQHWCWRARLDVSTLGHSM